MALPSHMTKYIKFFTRRPGQPVWVTVRRRESMDAFNAACLDRGVEVLRIEDAPEAKREVSRPARKDEYHV